MVCVDCGRRTEQQVHALCFMPEIQKIEETATPGGIFKKQILAA
jgi:NMD protein affecting ribosome stability and mRNA decay